LKEASNASPQAVIWQLSPTSRMSNTPLVHDTSNQINQHGDQHNDTKDPAGSKACYYWFGAAACCLRADFEEVGAFIWIGSYE
jgi:hypothetical protein